MNIFKKKQTFESPAKSAPPESAPPAAVYTPGSSASMSSPSRYVSKDSNVFTDDFLTSALELPSSQTKDSGSFRFSSFNPFTYNNKGKKKHRRRNSKGSSVSSSSTSSSSIKPIPVTPTVQEAEPV